MSETGHPGLDTWIAYRTDELSPEREDELRDHLVDCPECLALVSDLAAFEAAEEGPASGGAGQDAETAAEIDAIVERAMIEAPGSPVRRIGLRENARRSGASSWTLRIAACLLAAVALAALFWAAAIRTENRALEERLAQLAEPRPGAAIVDLYPRSVTRNGRTDTPRADLDPGTPYVTWLIHLPPGAGGDRYRAELRDAEGKPLWRGGGLARDPRHHTVTLGLPGDRIGTGRFVLHLWPEGAPEGADPAAVYELDVAREEERPPG